jgi:hypothetical protein
MMISNVLQMHINSAILVAYINYEKIVKYHYDNNIFFYQLITLEA